VNRRWPDIHPDAPAVDSKLEVGRAYWEQQQNAQGKNLERLREGLKAIDPKLPIWVLEERGSFSEPLDVPAMQAWIEGAKKL
jgi:hypothetical protein